MILKISALALCALTVLNMIAYRRELRQWAEFRKHFAKTLTDLYCE